VQQQRKTAFVVKPQAATVDNTRPLSVKMTQLNDATTSNRAWQRVQLDETPLGYLIETQKKQELSKVEDLQRRRDELQQTLLGVQRQRRAVMQLQRRQDELKSRLEAEVNIAYNKQVCALRNWQSAVQRHQDRSEWIRHARQWDVLSDCFYMAPLGPFATINGLRLGSEATMPVPLEPSHKANMAAASPAIESTARRYLPFATTVTSNASDTSSHTTIKVSWAEINAALGQVTLLLYVLSRSPHVAAGGKTPLTLWQYILQPCGSASKIGVRSTPGGNPTFYPLFAEDGLYFFGRRPLQYSLPALVQFVAQLAQILQHRDKTMVLPHMIAQNDRGDVRIGGLSVAYDSSNLVEWTRAMKYLLTNVKHLLLFRGWHVSFHLQPKRLEDKKSSTS
jgi:Apg6 BARA domain